MKRKNLIIFSLMTGLIFIMASCEKSGKDATLIGKWEVIKMEVFVYSGGELVSQDTYQADFYMLQFNEDGKMIVYFDPLDLNDTEVLDWSHTTDPVREGDLINVDGDDFTVESLTERTLVFSAWESSTDKIVFTLRRVN